MKRFVFLTCFAALLAVSAHGASFRKFEVEKPVIGDASILLTDFGAVGDGMTDNTKAFAEAVEALAERGGGRLVVPDGIFLTATVELKSHIELHLEPQAVMLFRSERGAYQKNMKSTRHMLCATDATDIAITGEGLIEGQGEYWRRINKNAIPPEKLKKFLKRGGMTSADGKYWYPSEKIGNRPKLVMLTGCRRVLLQDVTVQNSPMWNIHLVACEDVTVEGIEVRCEAYAQNGDGVDIDACRRVAVRNSTFDVGDDAICLKSGVWGESDGICRDILVEHCRVYHGHGGFVVGSEMSGGVENVLVRNCTFSNTATGLRFKTLRGRGGVVENIFIENVTMNKISSQAITLDMYYTRDKERGTLAEFGDTTPVFRNIHINSVRCHESGDRALSMHGLPESMIAGVTIENATLHSVNGNKISNCKDITLKNVVMVNTSGAQSLKVEKSVNVKILDK